LKNLTLNKPSIIIYPYRFKETINQEFLIFFKKLEEVNIAQKNSSDAAKFININYDKINDWWYNNKTQTIREDFSNIFAKKNSESLKILIKSLSEN
jgi:putative transferase (TIGR04331 family)